MKRLTFSTLFLLGLLYHSILPGFAATPRLVADRLVADRLVADRLVADRRTITPIAVPPPISGIETRSGTATNPNSPSVNSVERDPIVVDTIEINIPANNTANSEAGTRVEPREARATEARTTDVEAIEVGSTEIIRRVESNGTEVILPASYSKQKTYPALVIMPPTNRTAAEFFDWALIEMYKNRKTNPFIVILPGDRGSRADYSSGEAFEAAIEHYEQQVKTDLDLLIPKYNIDARRVSIAGFSLGADLAWALSVRNADLFSGAILIDSLCSYRNEAGLNRLANKAFHFFMIAGQIESGEADHPMSDVKRMLDRLNISNVYESFPDASHGEIMNDIPNEMLMRSIDFVLFNQ